MTCYWIAASEQWTIPNAEYSFSDVHSLEWSNLLLSNRFKWMDYASMKLHCFHSLVVESTKQLSLSTCPTFHSLDTITTPAHHSVERSWSIAILYSREYFVLIEAFRMYWDERSIPISRHYHRSLSFSLIQPHIHPSCIHSSPNILIHLSLTSIESLHHSLQHPIHFTSALSSHPTGHLLSVYPLIPSYTLPDFISWTITACLRI